MTRHLTPDLTLTLAPVLWGARGRQGQSRGSAECLGGVFPRKTGRPFLPASTNQTNDRQEVFCLPIVRLLGGRSCLLGTR